jgi:hypothetical protein
MPFSWRRMLMTGRFYWPTLKLQVICYPLIILILSILVHSINGERLLKPFATGLFSTLQTAMFVFAPLALIARDRRTMAALLPIPAREQTLFMLLYFLVAVPAVIFGISELVRLICQAIDPATTLSLETFSNGTSLNSTGSNICTTPWLFASLCLLCVTSLRHNTMMKSILITVGAFIAYYVTVSTFFVLRVLNYDHDRLIADDPALRDTFVIDFAHITNVISAISLVIIAILLFLTYRSVRKYQA